MLSDNFLAVCAGVFLIVASADAEGNEAASEPASNKAENQTQDPGECALSLVDVSHSCVLTVMACGNNRVVGPVACWIGTVMLFHILHNNHLLRLAGHHHGLTWRHHDGLTWCHHHGLARLLHHGLARLLHHRLSLGHHGLTRSLHHRLLLHWGVLGLSSGASHGLWSVLRNQRLHLWLTIDSVGDLTCFVVHCAD